MQQRRGLVEEDAVVADVIDDFQGLVDLRLAQAATELLQPQDLRCGRAQHEDGVDVGQVDALVEHVDGEDDVELTDAKSLEGGGARGAAVTGMYGDGIDAGLAEVLAHEVGMHLGTVEGERPEERVGDEIEAGDDELASWATARGAGFFLRADADMLAVLA